MSKEQYARTELLIGTEGLEILRRSMSPCSALEASAEAFWKALPEPASAIWS